MDTFTFTLMLTDNYYQQLKKAKKSSISNTGRCWFDSNAVTDKKVHVTINQETISITYNTRKSTVQDCCSYGEVATLIETREGIFLRIEHKGFLFLPVSDNGLDNENLMSILRFLASHCRYVHKHGNLSLTNVSPLQKLIFRLRPSQGTRLDSNAPILFALPILLVSLFIGTIFCSMIFQRPEIAREEAISLTATYIQCDSAIRWSWHRTRSIDLEFSNATEQTIDGCCSTKALLSELEALPAGTEMHLLIHPVSNDVLEIVANGNSLLEFSESIRKLRNETFGFFCLGLFLYVCGIFAALEAAREKR